jgi:RNA recognition motif-containing protein
MGRRLYVGNLGSVIGDGDLVKLFEPHGTVDSAQIVVDKETGRSKGFGFVEMKNPKEAEAAMAAINGRDREGRALVVTEARPRGARNQGVR